MHLITFTRVLALYDPFGVDVPLKFDTHTHTLTEPGGQSSVEKGIRAVGVFPGQ